MYVEEYTEVLRRFWVPFLAYLTLLSVLLIFLGIGLAGWVSALRDRERKRAELDHPDRL